MDMNELPQWIISSYAPGKDPPVQLIDNADLSFEESRFLFYTNPQQYVSLADREDYQGLITDKVVDVGARDEYESPAGADSDQEYLE